ncbi:MAG: tetratricopeptide repeat protein [bacterium]|nr:MAG: tetratricopeptide repeat protein [bacterium]
MKDRFTKNPTAHDHWVKGNELFDQGKVLPSIEYFKKAVREDKKFAEAYNNMGIAYFEMRDYRHAQECFKQAVLLKPEFVEALMNLGSAYLFDEQPVQGLEVQTRKPRLRDAAMAYEQVISVRPEMAEVYMHLGLVYEQMHRTDDALKSYRRFKELWDGTGRYLHAVQERIDRLEMGRRSGISESPRVESTTE